VTGPTGETGPTGVTGATGVQGASGAGLTDPAYLNSLYVSSIQGYYADVNLVSALSIQQARSQVNPTSGPTGTVNYDWSTGDVFYIDSLSSDWTANITNLPTTANKSYGVVFIIVQGATPYFINGLEINSSAVTVLYPAGGFPSSPTPYNTEVLSFTLYYSGSTWTVLTQFTSFTV
jgi:hypothetical protein